MSYTSYSQLYTKSSAISVVLINVMILLIVKYKYSGSVQYSSPEVHTKQQHTAGDLENCRNTPSDVKTQHKNR